MSESIDFRSISVVELARRVRAGEMSAREAVGGAFGRIAEVDGDIRAFVAVDAERAFDQAAAVDQLVASGVDPGPLAGVPVAVKDGEDVEGYRTTQGSVLLRDALPAREDSAHVRRLRAAGAVVVGKTNLPEFAWAPHTTNALFGTTHNPWNLDHSAGGSSGGSAAALASGMVPLATGSDGGGSIRIPSACCGLTGFKPSLGRVPSGGPFGEGWLDFSTRGPMALRAADLAAVLDVVVGPEPTDMRSLPRPEANWRDAVEGAGVPLRIAWSSTLGYAPVEPEVVEVCRGALGNVADNLGVEVVEVEDVFATDPMESWLVYVGACLLRTLDPLREHAGWPTVDPILGFIAEAARSTTGIQFAQAIDECHRMNQRLVDLFRDVRLLVTPTMAVPPPPIEHGGWAMLDGNLDANWVRFTYPFNMTRSPAATVCAGLSAGGLPIGLQLVGPHHGDLVVLRAAAAFEDALGFETRAPIGASPPS